MLVAINAEAGSGKSTVADLLARKHEFVAVALADEMKRILAKVYGFSRDQLWGPSAMRNEADKRYPRPCRVCHGIGRDDRSTLSVPPCFACGGSGFTCLTPRQALQELGDWGRAQYPDTWVSTTLRDIDLLMSENARYGVYDVLGMGPGSGRFVIPDARYRNELVAIRAKGGRLLRIKGVHQPMPGEFSGHSSEKEQKGIPDDYFDVVVMNDADLPTLYQRVEQALGL
jgi:hypothetical protein